MSDVERAVKFGEWLRAHPSLETFLCGFLCGTLATIFIWLVCYFVSKRCCEEEDPYTPRLEKLDAFISWHERMKQDNGIERYEDTKEFKEKMRTKADQIVERIMAQAYYIENRVPYGVELVVFISLDLMEALAWLNEDLLQRIPYPKVTKICGYEVKPINGTDEVYIGVKA